MKIEKFEELLDQYGWDISSWPEPLRHEANILVARNDEAAELLRSLKSVEDFLADDPLPMGKHRAIDDIFAAIEAEAIATEPRRHDAKSDVFSFSDERPGHSAEPQMAEHGDDPAPQRRTYPSEKAPNPVSGMAGPIDPIRAKSGIRVKSSRALLRYSATFASACGMVLCVMFGFVVGVVFTSEQAIHTDVQATEMPMVQALENHVFDEASQGMGIGLNGDNTQKGRE